MVPPVKNTNFAPAQASRNWERPAPRHPLLPADPDQSVHQAEIAA